MKLYVTSISTFIVFALISISGAATPLPAAKDIGAFQFKSFREWKFSMVSSAELQAKQSRSAVFLKQRIAASSTDPNLIQKSNPESGLSSQLQELQKQAEKDEYQLTITKELTISDYFVGYLTKQSDIKAAINEVSGRLSPEEIAELMAAYANNFFSSRPTSGLSPARAGSTQ